MAGDNVRKMVYELLDKPGDHLPEHIQTVKITATAHAKLRALADLVASRSKTPLAADLLMAAIDDAIEALPADPLDEATVDKLLGVKAKFGVSSYEVDGITYDFQPKTLREVVLHRADDYLSLDERDRRQKDKATLSVPEPVSRNGVHK